MDWSDFDMSDYQFWEEDNSTVDDGLTNASMTYSKVGAAAKNLLEPCNRTIFKEAGYAR